MMANSFFLFLVSFVGVAVSTNVAPDDFVVDCLNMLTGREEIPNNQIPLLDTQNYWERTLVTYNGTNRIWLSENFDGKVTNDSYYKWVDLVQSDDDCRHAFIACDTDNLPQDNWLITQYINATAYDVGVQQLVVQMEISTAGPIGPSSSFAIYKYETNEIDETNRDKQASYTDTGARINHTVNGKAVEYQPLEDRFSVSSTGLYLSVVDSGSCIRIQRIYVYYYACREGLVNYVYYPRGISPPTTNPSPNTVTGKCVENSLPITEGDFSRDCKINGEWETVDHTCGCNPGYQGVITKCQLCRINYYKTTQSNEQCRQCPLNSNTQESLGSKGCICNDGYYRAENEDFDVQCTAPPKPPSYMYTGRITNTTVFVRWLWVGPNNLYNDRNDYFFNVTYISTDGTIRGPKISISNATRNYTFTGLEPGTEYNFTVIALNGVSHLAIGEDTSNSITATTEGVRTPSDNGGGSTTDDPSDAGSVTKSVYTVLLALVFTALLILFMN